MEGLTNQGKSLENHGYVSQKVLSGGLQAMVEIVCRSDQPAERFVAKTLALGSVDPKVEQSALQEVKLLKDLKHPSLVKYIESWMDQGNVSGRLIIIMEYAEHGDLHTPKKAMVEMGQRLQEKVVKLWLHQMLGGLKYVHSKNVVHRDLKTANVFLTNQWRRSLLGDFGISVVLQSTAFANSCVGTPSYMAPELVRNEKYAAAVDMWAVGVILYELMALRLPFEGACLLAIVYQVAYNNPEEGVLYQAGYSKNLAQLVLQLLSKEPSERPKTVAILEDMELWSDFEVEDSERLAVEACSASEQAKVSIDVGLSGAVLDRAVSRGVTTGMSTEESWCGAAEVTEEATQQHGLLTRITEGSREDAETPSTKDTSDAREMLLAAGFNPGLLDAGDAAESTPAQVDAGPAAPSVVAEPEPEEAPKEPAPSMAPAIDTETEPESAEDQELRAELRLARQNSSNIDEPQSISPSRFEALLQRLGAAETATPSNVGSAADVIARGNLYLKRRGLG